MRNKVLIIDDMDINRGILQEILEDEYETVEASNGKQALEIIDADDGSLAVILLDIMMPVMNGFDVLNELNKRGYIDHTPVLVISGDTSADSEEKCLALGAADFIRKPFNDLIVTRRVHNTIELYNYKLSLEDKVEKQTKKLSAQNIKLSKQAKKLEETNRNIIDLLATVVESRNLESGDHIQKVKSYTNILANQVMESFPELGLTKHAIDIIVSASVLHDVGKIAIPDNILLKPGRLTKEEFEEMKLHTVRGCHVLRNIKGTWSKEYAKCAYDICRHHHERFDGRGYPDGLSGSDIPLSAQIVSIADVYDALVSKRIYKDPYGIEEAFNMIINGECGVFSPEILECFKAVKTQFEALAKKHS